ncbi:MarR family winged helix-turn-helix transcriptional regulator [Pediococcus inopinatus]|uniref:MarR family winged helix-turn-helix transcriptional regulator n=3 Tax=Lactobacillaceae TaxID=33958 RepID=UPI002A6B20C1|nr:MarR family winged helix-turn-helix transcriptional regulator [Pediococcus inopinatus]WPC19795.1 MarR family winged helix-turn-helix transcriptional regulator [Pediococcus inopinatus]WPP09563.1 MarR family winged helix-turn-helix transcriptional regulator [Pediococcus inopinatus]
MMLKSNPMEFANFSKMYRLFLQTDSHLKSTYSISFEQYRIMAYILSLKQQEATVSEVGNHFGSSSPAISRKIRVLFNLHYIVDHADSHDRRVHWLNLTPEGKELTSTVADFLVEKIPDIETQVEELSKTDLNH